MFKIFTSKYLRNYGYNKYENHDGSYRRDDDDAIIWSISQINK